MDSHEREPCPHRIIDDLGGAFAFGAVTTPPPLQHLELSCLVLGPRCIIFHTVGVVEGSGSYERHTCCLAMGCKTRTRRV